MKHEIKRWILIAVAFLLLALCAMLTSCRTKKKVVEKEDIKLERIEAIEVSESIAFDITKDSLGTSVTNTVTTNNDESIDVVTADSTKTVTITKEEKDGKTIWTGTNVKKISVSKKDNTTKTNDSTNVKLSEVDKSIYTKEEKTNTEVNIDFSKDRKNLNIKSTNAWVSIAIGISIILAVLLIIYLLYRKYRDKLPF